MIVLVKDIKEATCVTHSGTMHADEVFATAFLDLYLKDIKICRTLNINEVENDNVIVYDIGRGKYDHHQLDAQKRENGITYSSFGLLWKEFGKKYLEEKNVEYIEDVFQGVDKDLVEAIDADDNGVFPKIEAEYKVKTLSNVIKLFNPSYKSNKDSDLQFMKAVTFAREILEEEIETIIGKVKAKYQVLEIINQQEGTNLILPEYMPYEDTVLSEEKANNFNFVIFPSNRGGYNIKTLAKSQEDKTSRKEFPTEWAGLVDDELEQVTGITGARFCHSTRFLVSCDSLETALKLIDKALSSEINKEQ